MDLEQFYELKDNMISAILEASNPIKSVEMALIDGKMDHLQAESLKKQGYTRFHIISVGKAAVTMAKGLINQFGDEISGGVIVHKSDFQFQHENWQNRFLIIGSSHPVPDQQSMQAANEIMHFLAKLNEQDFVYFLISGGGSALMTLPENDISLEDMMQMNRLLLECGADINEINCIRKHIDQMKGGKLIRKTAPAGFCTLILSDVLGDPVDVIASGPTVADQSTYSDALQIINRFQLQDKMPQSIYRFLQGGISNVFKETTKVGNLPRNFIEPIIIGGNKNSLHAAEKCAIEFGLHPVILSDHLVGEARKAAAWIIQEAGQLMNTSGDENKTWCFLCGGETTVTIRGNGLGGRNLELALAAINHIDKFKNAYFVTFATDGEDGPTDAAGAWLSNGTQQKAESMGLSVMEYLENNDSYHFFDKMDQLIKTGSSGTNVNDICFLIIEK